MAIVKLNSDQEHDEYQRLWHEIHQFLDSATAHLHPENDASIRQQLTDEFRFWRRPTIQGGSNDRN